MEEFIEKSGWFMPSVEGVLVKKMSMQLTAFQSTKCGVYLFIHKTELHKKYVGKSRNLCQDMVHLFHRLFEKPEGELVAEEGKEGRGGWEERVGWEGEGKSKGEGGRSEVKTSEGEGQRDEGR